MAAWHMQVAKFSDRCLAPCMQLIHADGGPRLAV